jgi:hypothetical protein
MLLFAHNQPYNAPQDNYPVCISPFPMADSMIILSAAGQETDTLPDNKSLVLFVISSHVIWLEKQMKTNKEMTYV